MDRLPLEGIRVLEMAEIWAGPYCGSLLGDLGAQVMKVEAIQRIGRGQIHPGPGAPGYPNGDPGNRPWNRSANFNAINRNKLSITLDLGNPKGLEIYKTLASISDVIVCNYAVGVMEAFGLTYQTLESLKPDIIVVPMPGYGNSGPYREFRSMGMTLDAISGHSAIRGYPDVGLETISAVHHPNAVGGATAVFAICAALYHRARTGQGQFVDMAQSESMIPHLGEYYLDFAMNGREPQRLGNRHTSWAPQGCYQCKGTDRWVTLSIRSDEEWQSMCEIMDMPQSAFDTRFIDTTSRRRNHDALDNMINSWSKGLEQYEIMELLQAAGIPAGPVLDCARDAYSDPHLNSRGYFRDVTHPEAGTHKESGTMWKFSDITSMPLSPAPSLGQHNRFALIQLLGLSQKQFEDLSTDQIIGVTPLEGADQGGVRRLARQKS